MVGSVLVVSARMGAGHDGAARELCQRLEADGLSTRTVDFLDASPLAGRLMKLVYETWLRAAPWAYEATYRVWFLGPILCAPLATLLTLVFGRRIRRWAAEMGANTVVSTYPLASVVLGRLRRRRWRGLPVPAVTFVTDFAVHPLWVHPGIDLNLCVHPGSAARAESSTGRPARAPGPLVSERFLSGLPDTDRARAHLGLPASARVVLVVAGSWGVGELEKTFDALAASGRYLPVAVCGRNERLRRRLAARRTGLVLGWTDEMPTLMAASDVLVQNAGGLTCMEAFAAGLPVVTFRPIPGHGRQNALDMADAGVARFAVSPEELLPTLDTITSGGAELARLGRDMFRGDAARDVREIALSSRPIPFPVPAPRLRRVAAASVAAMTLYAGVNVGADAAAAHGLDQARPPANSEAVYLGMRVGPAQLADPALLALLARDQITPVVEGTAARARPGALRRLAEDGLTVANGGWGPVPDMHLLMPGDNVTGAARAIAAATGEQCRLYVPGPTVNATDLTFASAGDERIVVGAQVSISSTHPVAMRPGKVFILDPGAAPGTATEVWLQGLQVGLGLSGATVMPLSALPPPPEPSES